MIGFGNALRHVSPSPATNGGTVARSAHSTHSARSLSTFELLNSCASCQGIPPHFGLRAFAAPHQELTAPHQKLTAPHQELTAPRQELAAPHQEVTAPHQELTAPHQLANVAFWGTRCLLHLLYPIACLVVLLSKLDQIPFLPDVFKVVQRLIQLASATCIYNVSFEDPVFCSSTLLLTLLEQYFLSRSTQRADPF
jgi:hypothetical protein